MWHQKPQGPAKEDEASPGQLGSGLLPAWEGLWPGVLLSPWLPSRM